MADNVRDWSPTSLQRKNAAQQATYGDKVALGRVVDEMAALPPLVTSWEIENLRGQLCEGTGSNVFVVIDGELITPTLSSGCLAGITRELVLEWCEVSERDLPLDVLQEADEVFLASTTRDVQGLHRIDERELDAPGPVTAQTAKVFAQRSQENVDP